ncbi:MAG: 3-phosphoshikimate 1-carboxyvinyltransferase [Clostridia bacterium]|nr:3-phosphoshikimate 1-carboxyvinyltransferase [Clostridia bacterium]
MKKYSVKLSPSRLSGCVTAPPSKSISHRALICAALAEGVSVIKNLAFSQDILATIDTLRAIGTEIEEIGADCVKVRGISGKPKALSPLCCRESGSTLRFLIPICLLSAEKFELTGSEKLLSRPLGIYSELFGDRYRGVDKKSLTLSAGEPISAGEYRVAGNVSSQFITGLLFALPLCEGDSKIVVEGNFESASYVDLTLDTLAKFGIKVKKENNIFYIKGGQNYLPANVAIEGDASNAAFFEAVNFIGGDVKVLGLNPDSLQGDMAFKKHFCTLKAASHDPIDLSDCPDLAPVLFTVAAFCGGGAFTHTDRLRLKESDRIESMKCELGKFGAEIQVFDGLDGGTVKVLPSELHAPSSPLDSHNDHRVAMALAILCTRFGGVIEGAESVSKSMPDFFEKLEALGAEIKGENTNE